jgi:hypothetical protein
MAKPWTVLSVVIVFVSGSAAGTADAHESMRRSRRLPLPSHFTVGDQVYDGTIPGLRSYLESIRGTEPELYAKLSPDVDRMQSRVRTAALLLGAGVLAGVGTTVYGAATRPDCVLPPAGDPGFAAKVDQWSSCNDRGTQRFMTFTGIGLGLLLAGGISAMAIAPRRSDTLAFVNRHNSLSPRPMRFDLGYDPARRFAHAGATFSF